MSSRERGRSFRRALLTCVALLVLAPVALAGGPGSVLDPGAYYHLVMLDTSFVAPGGGDPDVTWLTSLFQTLGTPTTEQWAGSVLFGLLVPSPPDAADPSSEWSWVAHQFGSAGDLGDFFGTWEQMVAVVGEPGFTTGTSTPEGVDGLAAIHAAVDAFPLGPNFTSKFTLVTDGPPVSWGLGATPESAALLLEQNDLNTIVDHGFGTDDATPAMGVYWGLPVAQTYLAEPGPDGPFSVVMGGGPTAGGDPGILANYVNLSMLTKGASFSILAAESDGDAFRQGFRDVKIAEVGGRGGGGEIPEPATAMLFLAGIGLAVVLARRRAR